MGKIQEAIKRAKSGGRRNVQEGGDREQGALSAARDGREMVVQTAFDAPDSRVTQWGSELVNNHNKIQAHPQDLQEQRVIAGSEHDSRVEPYRQLRTQILKMMREKNWNTLAITSANEGAGKSLTAANLGISLSRRVGTSVLLVDLDLRTPTLHEKLGFSPEQGLVDFLEGRASLEATLFDPGLEQLTVLAGRPAGKFSSELLASPRMKTLMDDLCRSGQLGITIFDLPPLLRNDDALLFTPYVDATLLIVEDEVTTMEQLEQAMRLLHDVNVIGAVLNKFKE